MTTQSDTGARLLVYGERRCSRPSAPSLVASMAALEGIHAAGLPGIIDVIMTTRDDTTLEVSFIETLHERQKGHAGRAIKIITEAADAAGVKLILKAQACPPKRARRVLSTDELVQFYERREFRVVSAASGGGILMERPPKRRTRVSGRAA